MAAPMFSTDTALVVTDDAGALDFHQLQNLQQQTSWARDRSLLDLQRAVAGSDLVISAWRGDVLVGCVRVLSDFVYRAILCDVIVHPHYQQQGIGRQLVEEVTGHPRLARVQKFTLLTSTARSFYERLGWRRYPGEGMIYEREECTEMGLGDE
ncbi:MAG TPA: GNAT family N-acetyltransferase [Chloroflexota bacterium]|nr:GNAT family N-acetyltransferase [Chloroflexota bacterium]